MLTRGKRFVRDLIRAGGGTAIAPSDRDLDVYAEVLREPSPATASSECYRTVLTREVPATLRRYQPDDLIVPTLLVMGEDSPLRHVLDPSNRDPSVIGTTYSAGEEWERESEDLLGSLFR